MVDLLPIVKVTVWAKNTRQNAPVQRCSLFYFGPYLPRHPAPPRPCRQSWQQLLARVFQIKLTCPRCGGPLRVLASLTDPHSIRTCLDGVGLDSRPSPVAPARRPPQTDLDFAA